MSLLRAWRRTASCHLRAVSGVCLLIGALLLSSRFETSAQAAIRPEQLKAAFLFRFAQFTQWPPEAFSAPGSPLVLGILGEDPFGEYLDEIVRGEQVQDRPFVIQRYRRFSEMRTCHVLFISPSETARLDQILAALGDRSILTVAEAEGFAGRGGMIEIINSEGRIRLRINPAAAKAARLTLSSKLLRPAEIVETRRE